MTLAATRFQFSVRYRRDTMSKRIYRVTVVASTPDEARVLAKARDPLYSHSTSTPRKGKAVVAEGSLGAIAAVQGIKDRGIQKRSSLQGRNVTDLERGIAVFDAPRCRFCKRSDVIEQGIYTRVSFPDGIDFLCDLCREKADDPRDTADWRDTEIEVV